MNTAFCAQVLADHGFIDRMILVEFAVDDVQKLKVHQLRVARTAQKSKMLQEQAGAEASNSKNKKGRQSEGTEGRASRKLKRAEEEERGAGGKRQKAEAAPSQSKREAQVQTNRERDSADESVLPKRQKSAEVQPKAGSKTKQSRANEKSLSGGKGAGRQRAPTKEVRRSRRDYRSGVDKSLLHGWDETPLDSGRRKQQRNGKVGAQIRRLPYKTGCDSSAKEMVTS
ncbi:MAG: hypothetical protein SGPRY_007726 [Prymnesium sp.]